MSMKWEDISRGSKVEGIEEEGMKILGSKKNLVGLCRTLCLECKDKCELGKLEWRMVVRKSKNGKDLWGLECRKRKIRVIRSNL